jgi:hypothetical protein
MEQLLSTVRHGFCQSAKLIGTEAQSSTASVIDGICHQRHLSSMAFRSGLNALRI